MKKILALLLVAVMIVSFCAACAKTEAPSTETETSTTESTTTETTETTETTDTEEVPDAATLVSDAFIDPLADWSQYDELIAEIKAETDFAHRTELMHKAEDILMSNWCVLPFYYYNDIYMLKDYVTGMYANLFGTKFFQEVKMTNGSDTLRANLASEPGYLDPALNSTVDGACLAAAAFSGLYTYNAEGKTEPFIVVTMNNQQYKWKYSEIETDQIDYIMPYVESHYNVSTTAEGRAYAGLSMGGATTSNMLMHHTELFGHYGIWSYANVNGAVGGAEGITSQSVRNHLSSLTVKPKIMLAAGNWDFGLAPVKTFGENLSELGLDYSYLQVPAAHDWECWQLIFANAAENFLWK